jgi:hypothetical protein
MYLCITRGTFDPARYDEIAPLTTGVAATLSRLPGFQSCSGGANRSNGAIVAVTTWDTEHHARFDRAMMGDIAGRLQASSVRLDPPEIYEVVVEA